MRSDSAGSTNCWASTPEFEPYIQASGDSEHEAQGLKAIGLRLLLWMVVLVGLALISRRPQMTGPAGQGAKAASNDNRVARGKYIVEGVAMCGMCHTPRKDSGEIDSARSLDGAAVWLLPAHPAGTGRSRRRGLRAHRPPATTIGFAF